MAGRLIGSLDDSVGLDDSVSLVDSISLDERA